MIRVTLCSPHLFRKAQDIIDDGDGYVGEWELLEYLVYVANRDGLEMLFIRQEGPGVVEIDLETMDAALEASVEMRPLVKGDNDAFNALEEV